MKHDLPSFVVLIDADNVGLDTISPILEEITRHGRIIVRRVYGDFTTPHLAGWRTKLAEHAIQPIQQYRNTTGKNASDSALIIDAMDLLHSRRFEGFCLVSSDSDFTRLATRIREDGLVVFGFGEKKAPKAFVNACDRYIYVENLIAPPPQDNGVGMPVVETPEVLPSPPAALLVEPQSRPVVSDPVSLPVVASAPDVAMLKPGFKPPALAMVVLLKAYTNVADEQGWATLERMSSYIHANHSDFDPRTYGCTRFIKLLQKTDAFDLELRAHKNGQTYFCRQKDFKPLQRPVAKVRPPQFLSCNDALIKAVTQATAANGWAPISTIGQQLKALGRSVKESGHSTLTGALNATGAFEMKGNGAARYFRPKGKVKLPAQSTR